MTMDRTVRKYLAALALYIVYTELFFPILAFDELVIKNITKSGEVGETGYLQCIVVPVNASIEWHFDEEILNNTDRINITNSNEELEKNAVGDYIMSKVSTVIIQNLTSDDSGNYTCVGHLGDQNRTSNTDLNLYFPPSLVSSTCNTTCPYKIMVKSKAILMCNFNVYEPTSVKWWKEGPENNTLVHEDPEPKQITAKMVSSSYIFHANSTEYSGVYYCEIKNFTANGTIEVQVLAPPTVIIDQVIPISSSELYLNWTVNTYFSPIAYYTLKLRKINDKEFTHHNKEIDKRNTSFVINGLQKSTLYTISLEVTTNILETNTTSKEYKQNSTTLDKDPIFVPNISINGFSATSVTIGWEKPPHDIAHLIHYYLLEARKKNENETRWAYHLRDGRNLPYMFDNLEPHSTYIFRVRACSDYTKTCGNWSQHMEAATLDGIPEKPTEVKADCGDSSMKLTWNQPLKKNAEIKGYAMEITGFASYRDRNGIYKNATWGPLSKFTTNDSFTAIVGDLQPNTRYTVRLSAVTRTRRRGQEVSAHCTTKPTAPDAPPRPKWRKIKGDNGKYMFKLYLPQMSERNGPICCYRVYVVRLPPYVGLQLLPLTSNIPVPEYKEVHSSEKANFDAYITDVFSNLNFPQDSELVIGDGQSWFKETDPGLNKEGCTRCLQKPRKENPEPPPSTSTSMPPVTIEDSELGVFTGDPLNTIEENDYVGNIRPKRSDSYSDYSKNLTMLDTHTDLKLYDGPLDSNSNYTLFVELITDGVTESIFSDYTSVLMPAPSPPVLVPSSVLEIALQITCAVAAVILLLMIIVCIRQTRRSRKMPPHAHLEMNSIPAIIRHMVGGFCGRQQLVMAVPPDKPPIAKEDLPEAYAERQADSDYLFQKEFELLQLLPDYFPDRTTHASEARENQHKNRYPDIKAYDQTRVKLCQIDSITGSDYINANYVRGYQDRKQFICAQGPTDTTVNDFWRMIWEHGLELIVMLTNLEEYSKIKCSKYWPEERGARAFGNITVHHVAEKRYSDYIVRELKITRQTTNSDGQPIVENNGIAKRNGDLKDAESSEPTSPREMKESGEFRLVRQYHFLMWKDFAAPEQPHSILKFIKRVNEAWSSVVGRPIVVHCSAGVGRTGTLVALDCLLEQLRATGQVAVFNTVAELRRQRNFLVQSLKQYVFVYRALVEYAHYGDTEISTNCLKPAVDRLRNTPEGTDKCLMEIEFEKILSHPLVEPLKSCAAGAGEELRSRNRSDEFLPYDRNRVILTPIPNRDYSTYINASFIEAYDNTEGFIITQDPLPTTIMDFWRMVSEHNVTTIVMLSELGDGKCPRYWDDGTVQYEHISVQYEESESCPYYTRRQFGVTNDKTGEVSSVRQLQYQGWPTAPGHVPEVTRGLAELADAAAPNHDHHGTMLVHCQFGTERSPLFVALCTLIQQLRVERRVDVSGVARAVRHQRARTIDTFLQYEFLYRAILNYAELHNLLEDS